MLDRLKLNSCCYNTTNNIDDKREDVLSEEHAAHEVVGFHPELRIHYYQLAIANDFQRIENI